MNSILAIPGHRPESTGNVADAGKKTSEYPSVRIMRAPAATPAPAKPVTPASAEKPAAATVAEKKTEASSGADSAPKDRAAKAAAQMSDVAPIGPPAAKEGATQADADSGLLIPDTSLGENIDGDDEVQDTKAAKGRAGRKSSSFANLTPRQEVYLGAICRQIAQNRFLPTPTQDEVFVGDGDYLAIGAEFLGHFVRLGGLKPTESVIDIGSGIGRMAVPLTQYLVPGKTRYLGIDPVADGVKWCQKTITPVYRDFRFQTVDLANELYNPEGKVAGDSWKLPAKDEEFDFATMVSVATHLPPAEVERYCSEIFRVLRPGGRLFMTAFIVRNAEELAAPKCDPRLSGLVREKDKPCWHLRGENPMAAVGFDEGYLESVLAKAGFALLRKGFGAWHGDKSPHYQDILIAQKPRRSSK
ncbi:class I SAM-dependent methyltransferase [Thalassospira marina]|nr:methyltransferase domain-containing protein [Thalassospira marina]